CAYNESVSLQLSGPLEEKAMERAVALVVDRHGSLRSVFSSSGTQMIELSEAPPALEIIDLSGLSSGQLIDRLAQLNDQWMRMPFDLARGPLFKPVLLILGPEEHIL